IYLPWIKIVLAGFGNTIVIDVIIWIVVVVLIAILLVAFKNLLYKIYRNLVLNRKISSSEQ
ncbi:MAG: hypothetical protein ABIH76_07090, partial [Candidatus Bathyarchaeota archaeon]